MTEVPASIRRRQIVSIVQNNPIVAFFTIALASSWLAWVPLFLIVSSPTSMVMIPGAFGPGLAAVLLTWLRGDSVRAWLREGLDWQVDRRWYVVALGFPIGLGAIIGAGGVVLTGTVEPGRLLAGIPMYPVAVALLSVLGGGQEEFGWRGYALPALQDRFDALTASIVIGILWAVWHLPAFLFEIPGYTGSFPLYVLMAVGLSIVFTWLYNSSGGSILLAMILHGGINAAPSFGLRIVGEPSAIPVSSTLLIVPVVWVVVAVLLLWYGRETLSTERTVTFDDRETDEAVEMEVVAG